MACSKIHVHKDTIEAKKLGQGTFGVVYQILDTSRPKDETNPVARKYFNSVHVFNQEWDVVSGIEHPNIARALRKDRAEELDTRAQAFNARWTIDYEFIEGITMLDLINSTHHKIKSYIPNEGTLRQLIKGGLEGLAYLHDELDIAHCDIKPDNIMIKKTILIVIDLGLARKNPELISSGLPGAFGYECPEYWFVGAYNRKQCDVFQYGACFYHLITGTQLFDPSATADHEHGLWQDRNNSQHRFPDNQNSHRNGLFAEMKKIVGRWDMGMACTDNKLPFRPDSDLLSLVGYMIAKNPKRRLSASSLLQLVNIEEVSAANAQELEDQKQLRKVAEEKAKALHEKNETKKKELADMKDELQKARKDVQVAEKEIANLRPSLLLATTQHDLATKKVAEEEQKSKDLQKELKRFVESSKNELSTVKKALLEKMSELKQLHDNLQQKQTELDRVEQAAKDRETKYDDLAEAAEKLESDVARLREVEKSAIIENNFLAMSLDNEEDARKQCEDARKQCEEALIAEKELKTNLQKDLKKMDRELKDTKLKLANRQLEDANQHITVLEYQLGLARQADVGTTSATQPTPQPAPQPPPTQPSNIQQPQNQLGEATQHNFMAQLQATDNASPIAAFNFNLDDLTAALEPALAATNNAASSNAFTTQRLEAVYVPPPPKRARVVEPVQTFLTPAAPIRSRFTALALQNEQQQDFDPRTQLDFISPGEVGRVLASTGNQRAPAAYWHALDRGYGITYIYDRPGRPNLPPLPEDVEELYHLRASRATGDFGRWMKRVVMAMSVPELEKKVVWSNATGRNQDRYKEQKM